MTSLTDIIAYLCKNYPHKQELSKARLTKMVYLADWRNALQHEKQLTDIKWIFNHYGPYVDDVINAVNEDKHLSVENRQNMFGGDKGIIKLDADYEPRLTEDEAKILDSVIESTKNKYWNDFIQFVYSTYPVRASDRYDSFDLPKLAKEYRQKEK